MKCIFNFYLLFVLVFFILTSCYRPKFKSVDKVKVTVKTESIDKIKDFENKKKDVSYKDLVFLFFNRSNFVLDKENAKKVNVKNILSVSAADFKAVAEWQVDNRRRVKLKNIKTGREYIVVEGDDKGEVIMLERDLFSYKFKINNEIIRIKR